MAAIVLKWMPCMRTLSIVLNFYIQICCREGSTHTGLMCVHLPISLGGAMISMTETIVILTPI